MDVWQGDEEHKDEIVRPETSDAAEILYRLYFEGKPAMMEMAEEARAEAEWEQKAYDAVKSDPELERCFEESWEHNKVRLLYHSLVGDLKRVISPDGVEEDRAPEK